MFRREGRLGHPEFDAGTQGHAAKRGITSYLSWERPALVIVFIAGLMFVMIYALHWVVAQFP